VSQIEVGELATIDAVARYVEALGDGVLFQRYEGARPRRCFRADP
jgi:hypothetical protein